MENKSINSGAVKYSFIICYETEKENLYLKKGQTNKQTNETQIAKIVHNQNKILP
jgi:hypothetical protein